MTEPLKVGSTVCSTCDTCKFWRKINGNEHGWCRSKMFRFGNTEKSPKNSLDMWSDDMEMLNFSTGPKFGCIHHQEKGEA